MGGGAGSLREVPPRLFYGTQRTVDLETEGNVELDGIMVENNFKINAYTTSQLLVRRLGLFCRIIACLPTMIDGRISAEPVLKAMRNVVSGGENILWFLKKTAHPRMLKRADNGESVVPRNVRAQLQAWQDHNSRISCDRGVLFEWVPAEFDLASFVMIMKHAEASKGLLWSCKEFVDGQDFTLVVKASADPEFRCSWRSMWPMTVCDSSSRGVVRTLSYNSRSSEGACHNSAGYVWVLRVPGNILLWTCSHAHLYSSLFTFVKEHFAGTGIWSPLDRCIRRSNRARPKRQRPARGDFTAALGGTLARPLQVSSSTTRKVVFTTYVLLYKTRSMCTSSRPTPTKLPAGRLRPCI